MKAFSAMGIAIVLLLNVRLASATPPVDDEHQISNREKQEDAAIASGNLDALISIYSPHKDLVVFDDEAPFEYVGIDAWRSAWRNAWPGPNSNVTHQKFGFVQEPRIVMSDGVAVQFGIGHWVTVYKDGHKVEYDYRVTQCWRREDKDWRIFHAHYSAPFDRATGKAIFTAKP
jgi:ketosteroid isomerase-like protein